MAKEKMVKDPLKEIIRGREEVEFKDVDDRMLRRIFSELRKEGVIFIAVGNFKYKRIEICTDEEKQRYFWTQLKSAKAHFSNTINPIKKYLSQEQLDYLHSGGLFEGENK